MGVFSGLKEPNFGLEMDFIVGGLLGLMIGAILGGFVTAGASLFQWYKNKKQLQILSSDNIADLLLPTLAISIELSIGMAIGALIGSLKLLGIGTLLGAFTGLLLIWITTPIVKRTIKD